MPAPWSENHANSSVILEKHVRRVDLGGFVVVAGCVR